MRASGDSEVAQHLDAVLADGRWRTSKLRLACAEPGEAGDARRRAEGRVDVRVVVVVRFEERVGVGRVNRTHRRGRRAGRAEPREDIVDRQRPQHVGDQRREHAIGGAASASSPSRDRQPSASNKRRRHGVPCAHAMAIHPSAHS